MQYEKIYDYAMHLFETELSANATYHNINHTKDVINAATEIARQESIDEDDMILLKTAALFHDIGYLKSNINHEELSCTYAEELLINYGYGANDIEKICTMIMATKVPQNPQNKLSEILCDADLYYLGGDQYEYYAALLNQEFKNYGNINAEKEWLMVQHQFLQSHNYFTATARKFKKEKKEENAMIITNQLKQYDAKKPKNKEKHRMFSDVLLTIFGVALAAFALKNFLVPNHFFDGGITGLSLLIHEIYGINLAIVIIALNLPLIAISYYSVGSNFAIRTLIAVILMGVFLFVMPSHALTNDKLLVSIFGGVFLGIGTGLVMRTGAALDGLEVLALYTLKRTSFKISEIILGLNILIFIIAAIYFKIEVALYSMLTYFAASRTIDYVVEGIQSYTGVTIISSKSEAIKYSLVNEFGRGITIYKGERGFLPGSFEVSEDCDIIFTIITRLELRKLTNVVSDIDSRAFIFANTIREASGGVLKKIHHH